MYPHAAAAGGASDAGAIRPNLKCSGERRRHLNWTLDLGRAGRRVDPRQRSQGAARQLIDSADLLPRRSSSLAAAHQTARNAYHVLALVAAHLELERRWHSPLVS